MAKYASAKCDENPWEGHRRLQENPDGDKRQTDDGEEEGYLSLEPPVAWVVDLGADCVWAHMSSSLNLAGASSESELRVLG